jgi:hypothetical protein
LVIFLLVTGFVAHPASCPMVTGRPEREADYSSPSCTEVENEWSYTFIPPYVFMAWCLVKPTDNFAFIRTANK